MNQRKLKVKKEDKGKRLDIFISLNNNDLSRTFIKKNIESNNVLVNGEVEYRANYTVQEGDEVSISFELETEKELVAQNIPLEIVYEDDDLVVINKKSGMSVHPMNFNEKGTVVNALLYRYENMKYVGNSIRTGLIHRLDKGTSGVLLIGKTNLGLWHYSKQFASRDVEKYYIAIATGQIDHSIRKGKPIIIENYLGRNPKNRKKFSILDHERGKYSKSEVLFINSFQDKHLFIIKPLTGRTHQIRIHLASIGFPIVGDSKYGGEPYERLMLHAWRLRTNNLLSKEIVFDAAPPEEFSNLFKNIEKDLDDFKVTKL